MVACAPAAQSKESLAGPSPGCGIHARQLRSLAKQCNGISKLTFYGTEQLVSGAIFNARHSEERFHLNKQRMQNVCRGVTTQLLEGDGGSEPQRSLRAESTAHDKMHIHNVSPRSSAVYKHRVDGQQQPGPRSWMTVRPSNPHMQL